MSIDEKALGVASERLDGYARPKDVRLAIETYLEAAKQQPKCDCASKPYNSCIKCCAAHEVEYHKQQPDSPLWISNLRLPSGHSLQIASKAGEKHVVICPHEATKQKLDEATVTFLAPPEGWTYILTRTDKLEWGEVNKSSQQPDDSAGTVSFHPDCDVGRARAAAGLPLTLPLKREISVQGWLTHVAGKCPTFENAIVDAKLRNGEIMKAVRAGELQWGEDFEGTITHYRFPTSNDIEGDN